MSDRRSITETENTSPPDASDRLRQELSVPPRGKDSQSDSRDASMEVGDVREYRKVLNVTAEVSERAFEWKTWKGEVMKAEAGDWKVTQPDGSISSCKPDIFAMTYESVPGKPGEYRKSELTKAAQLTRPLSNESLEGVGSGDIGDYLVTGAKGERYIVQKEKFEAMYELAEKVPESSIPRSEAGAARPRPPRESTYGPTGNPRVRVYETGAGAKPIDAAPIALEASVDLKTVREQTSVTEAQIQALEAEAVRLATSSDHAKAREARVLTHLTETLRGSQGPEAAARAHKIVLQNWTEQLERRNFRAGVTSAAVGLALLATAALAAAAAFYVQNTKKAPRAVVTPLD